MKRQLISLMLVFLLLLPAAAQAAPMLSAETTGEGVRVSWNEEACSENAVLTLYRNNWPVWVVCVDAEAGECMIPSWYMRSPGSYKVRLKTDAFCETVEVTEEDAGSDCEPDAEPDEIPGELPAAPTAEPTPVVTQKPADVPVETPSPTPAPTPSGSANNDLASQVVSQVNAERAAAGLGSLTMDKDLSAAACVRAQEIAELFSHTRPDGSSWSTVSTKAYGENIAMGYRTADAVMAGWMSSEGHRENILRDSFGSIGVCAYTVNGVTYWVQLFGK